MLEVQNQSGELKSLATGSELLSHDALEDLKAFLSALALLRVLHPKDCPVVKVPHPLLTRLIPSFRSVSSLCACSPALKSRAA